MQPNKQDLEFTKGLFDVIEGDHYNNIDECYDIIEYIKKNIISICEPTPNNGIIDVQGNAEKWANEFDYEPMEQTKQAIEGYIAGYKKALIDFNIIP